MTQEQQTAERKVFQAIHVGAGLRVMSSGGLVDVIYQPHAGRERYLIGTGPEVARRMAAALLKAADAAEGLPAGFTS